MLDSGSSVPLVLLRVLPQAQGIVQTVAAKLQQRLVIALEDELPVSDHVRAVQLDELKFMRDFVVVENIVTLVRPGVDFLHKNVLVLDFAEILHVCTLKGCD